MNNYRLEKIDHLTYTDQDWKRYYDFRIKNSALKGEPMPFNSMEKLKERNLESIKERGQEIYMVWKNGQENGTFYFSIEFKDDLEKRFTYLYNQMNDQFLEPNLLNMIFKQFIDYDETSNFLALCSEAGINDYVADKYSAQIGSELAFYELNVKEANVEKIDTWLAESPAKFPDFRIELFVGIPDDLLEEYAALYRQLWKDMPANSALGEVNITAEGIKAKQEEESDYCAYRYVVFNKANQLIAKTYVVVNVKQPQVIDQYMTGVKEKYRRRGLSKWIKAAMFKKLTTDFPELEKITTEAHPENHGSRALSKQMGYKKTGAQKEFLIDRSTIVQHLK